MIRSPYPTPYADVNAAVDFFSARIQAILGAQFVGMYLYGSLATGDFDPQHSDIDLIVLTDGELDDVHFAALRQMHEQFATSGSPKAQRIEAAYIPREALNHRAATEARYPQLETDRPLSREPLEIGWVFQRHSLREHAIVVAGADPRPLIDPVDPDDMRKAIHAIAEMWINDMRSNPTWLDWVVQREAQAFVVLTLCRCLYALDQHTIASKPAATRWAQAALDPRWSGLIERAVEGKHQAGRATHGDIAQTLALVRYVEEKSR
jgi:predicted nucleotidyltransferase